VPAAQRGHDGLAPDWSARTSAEIRKAEYRVSFQQDSVLPGHPGGLHAANRRQDLRVYFLADGVDVMRRTEAEPSWTLRLSPLEADAAGNLWPALHARPIADGRTATYRRDDLTERWENSGRGILIHFELPATGRGDVVFEIETDLEGKAAVDGSVPSRGSSLKTDCCGSSARQRRRRGGAARATRGPSRSG